MAYSKELSNKIYYIDKTIDNLPFGAFSKYIELGSDLKNGIYIVQIIQNGSVHNQKVMLVR